MPIALVRSISLPNLKIYTTVSLLLVSGCFYYAFDVVRTDPQWKIHQNLTSNYAISRPSVLKQSSSDALTNGEILSSLPSSLDSATTTTQANGDDDDNNANNNNDKSKVIEVKPENNIFGDEASQNQTDSLVSQLKEVAQFMTHEPFCIWVSIYYFAYLN